MIPASPNIIKRLTIATLFLLVLLLVTMFFGLAFGSSGSGITAFFKNLKGESGAELMNDMARTMGVNIVTTTSILLIVTSLMVSATVSYCGLVGFVGLVMPHMLRLIWGPDHRLLAPVSILGGAAFMVGCDILARTLPSQGEMPVGVVTALIGAPLFVYLLRKADR